MWQVGILALACASVAAGLQLRQWVRPPAIAGVGVTTANEYQALMNRPLWGSREITQSLAPVPAGLSEVDTYVYFSPHPLAAVRLRVVDGAGELRGVEATVPNAEDLPGAMLRFAFDPILDSDRRQLSLVFDAPQATPDTAVTLSAQRTATPATGYVDTSIDLTHKQDYRVPLSLRFGVAAPVTDQLPRAVDIASQYRPVKDGAIGWLAGLTAAGMVLLLLATVAVAAQERDA